MRFQEIPEFHTTASTKRFWPIGRYDTSGMNAEIALLNQDPSKLIEVFSKIIYIIHNCQIIHKATHQ